MPIRPSRQISIVLAAGLITAGQLLIAAAPARAGSDGTAGGASGFNPVGASATTPLGTANFGGVAPSQITVPVASFATAELGSALVEGGLSIEAANCLLAILLGEEVGCISPEAGADALAEALVADGAPAAQAEALAQALAALGAAPNLQALNNAINAFNALVNASDAAALPALAGELAPLRGFFTNLIAAARTGP
jgi:hypothetical protein